MTVEFNCGSVGNPGLTHTLIMRSFQAGPQAKVSNAAPDPHRFGNGHGIGIGFKLHSLAHLGWFSASSCVFYKLTQPLSRNATTTSG